MSPCSASVLLAVALLSAGGCQKSFDQRGRASERAVAAERARNQRATCELDRRPAPAPMPEHAVTERRDAAEEASEPRASGPEAIARERRQMRRMLGKEIAWLDRHLVDLQADVDDAPSSAHDDKQRDLDVAREWQTRLKGDLEAVDRVGDNVWSALRNQIERDLEEDHPPSVPRSYEKSYGI